MKIRKRKKRVDEAHDLTDIELLELEREIDRIYTKAYPKIETEWDKYMKAHAKDLEKSINEYQKALLVGSATEILLAKAELQRQAQRVTLNSGDFRRMNEKVAAEITKANVKAIDKVNGRLPLIYTINYNQLDKTVKSTNLKVDYSFKLTNEKAVKALAESDQAFLPRRKVDVPKDIAWNQKQINAQVMQGIQNGESIPKIAKRLQTVTDMSESASIRNARTMVTAAENKGRLDSYIQAEEDGVIMKKVWSCVHDNRTRNWHMALDGVAMPIHEPWTNAYGDLMFPGDPSGHPANVYNCRCAMTGDIEGFTWL